MSEFTLSEAVVTQTYMYVASLWTRSFFLRWITADPSAWGNFTPPKNNSVERPWGILSLFTTSLWKGEFTHNQKQVVKQASYVSPRRLCDTRLFRRYEWSSLKGRGPLEWTSLVPTKRPTVTKTPGGYIWCLCHYQPLIKGEFTHNQKQVVKQASYVSPRRLCDTRLFRRYEWITADPSLEGTSLVPTKRPTVTKTPGGYIWCLCHYQPLIMSEFTHNQKQVVKQASYVSPRRLCDTRLFRRYEWSSLKGRGPLEWTSLVPTKRPSVTKTPGGYIWCLCHYQPLKEWIHS